MYAVIWLNSPEHAPPETEYFADLYNARMHCTRMLAMESNPANKMVIATVNEVVSVRTDLVYHTPNDVIIT